MTERKYLPTVAELIDRLSIVLMKAIFIPGNRVKYLAEIELIKHDIDLGLKGTENGTAEFIYAILVVMLANRFIWENEAAIRNGSGDEKFMPVMQLRATHSINGVRNHAKNLIAAHIGERQDLKIDCLAADLPPEFGNWRVFD